MNDSETTKWKFKWNDLTRCGDRVETNIIV